MRKRLRRVGAIAEAAGPGSPDDAEPDEVVRDAEESLVAALHESDTAVETMVDSSADDPDAASTRRWKLGVIGLLLAALGIMVARRRS